MKSIYPSFIQQIFPMSDVWFQMFCCYLNNNGLSKWLHPYTIFIPINTPGALHFQSPKMTILGQKIGQNIRYLSQLMRLWHFSSSVNSFKHMRSNPVGLDVWFLVRPFVYFHTLCVRTAKALVRLPECAGSPEPSLVAYVISTIISWAGSFRWLEAYYGGICPLFFYKKWEGAFIRMNLVL